MGAKYYYKGMKLADYCRKNSIKYRAILTDADRLKKKNPDKSLEELLDMAMARYGKDKNKFKYNGISLYEYCKLNGLAYPAIRVKIDRIMDKNGSVTLDEAIKKAIDTYQKGRTTHKYYYKGISLFQYCKENNLKYVTFMHRFKTIKGKYPELSDEEIIEKSVNYVKQNKMYIYNGESLFYYCKKNNLSYSKIKSRIDILKSKDGNKDLSDKELIELAMSSLELQLKYFYRGKPLAEQCKIMGVGYNKILKRIESLRSKEQYKNSSMEEIIEKAMEHASNNFKNKYYYKGLELVEYCKENGLDVKCIRARISRLKEDEEYKNLEEDEIIELSLNDNNFARNSYQYKGVPLINYCKKNHIEYRKVRRHITRIRNNDKSKNLSTEEIVELAINKYFDIEYKQNYMYNGVKLKEYCKNNGIEYGTILVRIRSNKKKYPNLSTEEIIEKSLKKKVLPSKYRYKGMDLKEYCACNGLVYYDVIEKYRNLKKEKSYINLTEENLIDIAIKGESKDNDEYLYKNESLRKYCKDHGINYSHLVKRIKKLETKEEYKVYSRDQIIEFVLGDNRACVYHYKGLPFNVYCKQNNLNYDTILQRIYFLKRNRKNENLNDIELIDLVLSDEYGKVRNIYYYNGVTLKDYCKENGIKESTIRNRIKLLKNNIEFKDCSMDILLEMAIKKKNKKDKKM